MLFFALVMGLVGADFAGYGPEKLCNLAGAEYQGTVEVGGTKEGNMSATVPYCPYGPVEAFNEVTYVPVVIDGGSFI